MATTAYLIGPFSIILCVLTSFWLPEAVAGSSQFVAATELRFKPIDIDSFSNEDLSKTEYHRVHRRSAITPFIKKATSSIEKKTFPKSSSSSTEDSVPLKTLSGVIKEKIANSSLPLNYTEPDNGTTTAHSILLEEMSNATSSATSASSTASTTADTNSTVQSVSTPTSSSTSPSSTSMSVQPTTPMPVVAPTQPANVSNTTYDHHIYYNSSVYSDADKVTEFWVNFDELPQDKVIVHRMLSDSHRKAATVTLSFDFPFYGHPLRNITIATGGFIYMGDYMHSWLAATQYIAPLMANFDTSLSNDSTVRYFDNGTAFVIEWHSVTLQDEKRGGNFTFQATLLNSGNIVFVYKIIPVAVSEIGDDLHPVKVGLSDAYVIDRIIYFIRRKTIYEYHRIDLKTVEIKNDTAIYFTALTTCMNFTDCTSCMAAEVGSECVWCDAAKRCSDGLDRNRQDWLQSKCDVVEKQLINCSWFPSPDVNPYVQPLTDSPKPYTYYPQTPKSFDTSTIPNAPFKPGETSDDGASTSARVAEASSSMGVGSVVAVLLIMAIVLGGLVWVGYAYKNPHSSSGQLLIRYRPSQWRFRSGEARYTAASVHM